jgi:oxygen-independent coproporphyrinogen-3 oxidase
MAGIYIHIPFCDQACHYCDFHFSTTFTNYRNELIESLILEIDLKKSLLKESIKTIYFGGGTPSLLTAEELFKIITKIRSTFRVDEVVELTLECNPDHLNLEYLQSINAIGINRLSIGIQSFDDSVLKKLNRSHNANTAISALRNAKTIGFNNITIDLIYGIPFQTDEQLAYNLKVINQFEINHISAYHLTFEEKTVFGKWLDQGKIFELDDEKSLDQFKQVRLQLKENGFRQYEVSNFSKPDFHSKHNSSYWKGDEYLGIGPSAHSFIHGNRSWNIKHNKKYIDSIKNNVIPEEVENLSDLDQYNEYILLSLRQLDQGLDVQLLQNNYHKYWYKSQDRINEFLKSGHLLQQENKYILSENGIFIIDYISSELFLSHED